MINSHLLAEMSLELPLSKKLQVTKSTPLVFMFSHACMSNSMSNCTAKTWLHISAQ